MTMLESNTEVVPATVEVPATTVDAIDPAEPASTPSTEVVATAGISSRWLPGPKHTGDFDTEETVRYNDLRLAYALIGSTLIIVLGFYGFALLLNFNAGGGWTNDGGDESVEMSAVRDAITVVLPLAYCIIMCRAHKWRWAAAALTAFIGLICWYCVR